MITTTKTLNENAPGLLRNSIDERIVKIRPMSTPIDQLSRCGRCRRASSMMVEYYSVDTKRISTTLKTKFESAAGSALSDNMSVSTIYTNDDNIFEVSETILVPSVKGYRDGKQTDEPLVLYVVGKPSKSGIEVAPLNGLVKTGANAGIYIPTLEKDTELVRMGRASTELAVQTALFSAMPKKASNFCQIFKMQVEQSTLAKIADKEVNWNFNDQEEAAIIDMRLGMEKNFLFGQAAKLFDAEKNEDIYFTGGIWNQTDNSMEVPADNMTESDLIDICSRAFTGNNGSKRKILVAGTRFLEALSKIQYHRVVKADETRTKWGMEFKEIVTNFGTLYVLHSEVFDQCGHSSDAFVLDPNYMTKYVHLPFRSESLDLRRSGQRNTDAVVLTEASCLVLRYPRAHMRVLGTTSASSSTNESSTTGA